MNKKEEAKQKSTSHQPSHKASRKSSSKKRAHDGGDDASEHPEESRNNLYWYSEDTKGGAGFFCLWYGAASSKKVPRKAQVLPIGDAVIGAAAATASIISSSSSSSSGNSSNSSSSSSNSGSGGSCNSNNSSSSSGSKVESIVVNREQLYPLDVGVVRSQSRCKDVVLKDFMCALLDFAEWDDNKRDSYTWPSFIERLFENRSELDAWFKHVAMHPLASRTGTGAKGRRKFFLYMLCAQHAGIHGGYVATDQLDQLGRRFDSCSSEILEMLFHITGKEVPHVCSDYTSMPSVSFAYSMPIFDSRYTSRAGADYQSTLEGCMSCGDVSTLEAVASFPFSMEGAQASAVFQPDALSEDALVSYLKQVGALRAQFAHEGQVVDASTEGSPRRMGTELTETRSHQQQQQVSSLAPVAPSSASASSSSGTPLPAASTVTTHQDAVIIEELEEAQEDLAKPQTSVIDERVVFTPGTARRKGVLHSLCVILKIISPSISTEGEESDEDVGDAMNVGGDAMDVVATISSSPLTATIVGNPTNGLHTTALPLPSEGANEAKKGGALEQSVVVFDGYENWTVPISSCRFLTMPEDQALECLHAHNYDVESALAAVENFLRLDASKASLEWSPRDVESFLHISSRHPRNIRKIWTRYNASSTQSQQNSSASSSSSTKKPTLPQANKKSMKEIIDFYHIFHQGVADTIDMHGSSTKGYTLGARPRANSSHLESSFVYEKGVGGGTSADNNSDSNSTSTPPSSMLAVQHDRYGRYFEVPNRWPKGFPMMRYNMYWLKNSLSPCVCVGLDTFSGFLRVVPICCATYHHEVAVQHTMLTPLSESLIKNCSDERAAGFAMAMLDFAKWEIDSLPEDAPTLRWYEYPKFIRSFFSHAPTWAAWRKQAERIARGQQKSFRAIYFEALQTDFQQAANIDTERISRLHEIPWNDVPLESSDDESENDEVEDSHDAEVDQVVPAVGEKRKSKAPSASKEKAPPPPVVVQVPKAPQQVRSSYNLFWISKAMLPCIYFDEEGKEDAPEILVQPICCSTYHYAVLVKCGAIEPLTHQNLKLCTDERTHDFTLALMDFADWHRQQNKKQAASATASASASTPSSTYSFQWPDFIIELIRKPRDWASWRKKVERGGNAQRAQRKSLYFSALVEDAVANEDGGSGAEKIEDDDLVSSKKKRGFGEAFVAI